MMNKQKKILRFSLLIFLMLFIYSCTYGRTNPITGKRYFKSGNKYFKTQEQSQNQYFRDNPERPEKIKKAIRQKKVIVGMTAEEVLLVWPRMSPIVTRSVSLQSVYEQWVFAWPYSDDGYVYFKDGIVIATFIEHVTFR
ncbi:MAG: hypothetical protein V3S49_04365 [Thermodesulfobacteriota bacterium]